MGEENYNNLLLPVTLSLQASTHNKFPSIYEVMKILLMFTIYRLLVGRSQDNDSHRIP